MKRYFLNSKGQVAIGTLGLIASISITVVGSILGYVNNTNGKLEQAQQQLNNVARETSTNTEAIDNLKDTQKRIEAKIDTLLLDRGYSPEKVIKSTN